MVDGMGCEGLVLGALWPARPSNLMSESGSSGVGRGLWELWLMAGGAKACCLGAISLARSSNLMSGSLSSAVGRGLWGLSLVAP